MPLNKGRTSHELDHTDQPVDNTMTPKRVDREERAGQIVAAAIEVFARRGFAAATIDEIAREAGLGKGTLYQYFDSKEELFFAAFRTVVDGMVAEARQRASAPYPSAAARLRALVVETAHMDAEARRMFPLMFEFWAASASASPELRGRVARMFRDLYADFGVVITDTIRDGMAAGEFDPAIEPGAISAVLLGSIDGLWLQAWFDPSLNPVRMAERFIDVLLRGLAPPGTRR